MAQDKPPILLRPINPDSAQEIRLVATRMRETLIEVIGAEEGGSMYTLDWLEDRVRFHLDPSRSTAQVTVSTRADGFITGHCLVRVEQDEAAPPFGLFATTYVEPASRKQGIADTLLIHGESWMHQQGLALARTYTAESNTPLIRLYEKHGYAIEARYPEKKMIALARRLG